jgi:hypothetical protein
MNDGDIWDDSGNKLQEYADLTVIGLGQFGKVSRGRRKIDGAPVAIKEVEVCLLAHGVHFPSD